jgi:hypothetical protein
MWTCNGEGERGTQEGVMMGAGAAKTGLFWMREGGGGEAAEELTLAETEGRNVACLAEYRAAELVDERHQPLMEAVDIAHNALELGRFIP